MTIDPRITFWLGVWTSILLLVASGTISFDGALPAVYVPLISKWCAILGAINSTILTAASGYSSNKLGPMVSAPVSAVVKILLVAFVLSMFLAGGSGQAQAAGLKQPQITGDVVADAKANLGIGATSTATPASLGIDPEALIKKIIAIAQPDLKYAVAMAKYANTGPSGVRLTCWNAISDFNAKATGANLVDDKGAPLVAPAAGQDIFTNLERIAEGIDSLSPTGPLFTSCAGAAGMAGQNVLVFINALVAAVAVVAPK